MSTQFVNILFIHKKIDKKHNKKNKKKYSIPINEKIKIHNKKIDLSKI